MKRKNQIVAGTTRWTWVAIAVLTIVGASGAAVAKERTKSKPTTESTPADKPARTGYIGVHLQDLTDDVRKGLDLKVSKGVLVSGVEEDSPADEAGIEEGDVIVAFNGTTVSSPDELRDAVRSVEPGNKGRVDVMRDGTSRTITVTVGDRPEPQVFRWESGDDDDMAPMHVERIIGAMGGPRLGVQAHEIEDDGLASYFGAKKGDGLLVLSVDDESIAGKAGVKPGDIIRQVGDEKVTEVQDVRSALRDYKEGDQFDITVLRHGKTQALKATMDDQEHEFAFEMPAPEAFHWHGTPAPRGWERHYRDGRDDLRRELDDLRQELRELKEKFEERNDG